jgi:hypothetical protein
MFFKGFQKFRLGKWQSLNFGVGINTGLIVVHAEQLG